MKTLRSLLFASITMVPIAWLTSPELHAEVQSAAKPVSVDGYPSLRKHKPIKFTVIAQRSSMESVDLGMPGDSLGDISVFTGDLLNPKDQSLVGTYTTSAITLAHDKEKHNTYQIYTEVKFNSPPGTINYGHIHSDEPIVPGGSFLQEPVYPAIYGGTGQWLGVGGYVLAGRPIAGKPTSKELTFIFK